MLDTQRRDKRSLQRLAWFCIPQNPQKFGLIFCDFFIGAPTLSLACHVLGFCRAVVMSRVQGFPDYIGSLSKGLLGKFCHNPDTNRWYLNKALINIGMTLIRPYLVFGFAPGVLRTIFWQKHSKNKDLIRPY